MEPLVSIITPCYNSAAFITPTIQSVLDQTYGNWEMIIIDDKSKDDTCRVVGEFAERHENIKLVRLEENAGVSNARNVGLAEAKGKYIAFLDSDDIWLNEKLAKQVRYMEASNLPMSFCAYKRIDEAGKVISGTISVPKTVNYRQLLSHNLIIFSTSLTLRNAIGDLRFKKLGHEDWIFWLDLFKKCGTGNGLNEHLALYRIRKNSISSNKFTAIASTWNIFRGHEKFGLPKSIRLFLRYAVFTVLKRLK